MGLTTDPNDPELKGQTGPGQHKTYLVMTEEERAQGLVRPVRQKYIHVGTKVDTEGTIEPLEDHLDDSNRRFYDRDQGYVAYLKYPESKSPMVGKFLQQKELDAFEAKKDRVGGCGVVTVMGEAIAQTYARDPKFYGATFCVGCNEHLPVNEFYWDGTEEEVGS